MGKKNNAQEKNPSSPTYGIAPEQKDRIQADLRTRVDEIRKTGRDAIRIMAEELESKREELHILRESLEERKKNDEVRKRTLSIVEKVGSKINRLRMMAEEVSDEIDRTLDIMPDDSIPSRDSTGSEEPRIQSLALKYGLPWHKSEDDTPELPDRAAVLKWKETIGDVKRLLETFDAASLEKVRNTGNEKNKILIIEDDLTTSKIFSHFLEEEAFETRTARDGEEGLRMTREIHPDIILLDIRLPVMDGYEFLEKKSRQSDIRDIPVVIISALSREDDIKKGLDSGAVAYITKPFSIPQLMEKIKGVLY